MKKHIVFLLVLGFFISNVSITNASYNLVSTSLKSLLEQKAMHMMMTIKSRIPQSSLSMNPLNQSNFDTTFSFDASQDISTPGSIKASQSLTISGQMLSLFGGLPQTTIEDKIIGDTVYIKLPGNIINMLANGFSGTSSTIALQPDTWIQITKDDLASLPPEYSSFVSGFYNYLTTFNSQPIAFLSNHQNDWLGFTQALKVKRTGSKFIDGQKVNVFSMSLNKTILKQSLIKARREMYADGKLPKYELKSINDEVNNTNIKYGQFAIYANPTNLPSSFSGSIYSYNSYDKKLSSIIDIDATFDNYGVPLDATVPPSFITATQFFNQYVKPSMDDARLKGQDAAVKSMMSNMRAEAELVYSENNNSYGNSANYGNCLSATSGSLFNPTTASGSDVRSILSSISQTGAVNLSCYSNATSWAFSSKLNSGTNFCVDSTGAAKENSTAFTTACQ